MFKKDTKAGHSTEVTPNRMYMGQRYISMDTSEIPSIINSIQATPPSLGRQISNNMLGQPRKLKVGSDGSVFLEQKVANHDEMLTACFALTNVSSISSTRAELEDAFRSLKHIKYLGMEPEETKRWIDNLTAVKASVAHNEA